MAAKTCCPLVTLVGFWERHDHISVSKSLRILPWRTSGARDVVDAGDVTLPAVGHWRWSVRLWPDRSPWTRRTDRWSTWARHTDQTWCSWKKEKQEWFPSFSHIFCIYIFRQLVIVTCSSVISHSYLCWCTQHILIAAVVAAVVDTGM